MSWTNQLKPVSSYDNKTKPTTSFDTQNKQTTAFTGQGKSSSVYESEIKEGVTWIYNQEGIEYNTATVEGFPLLYNKIDRSTDWVEQNKS